jgi:hypothetical protein
MFVVNSSAAACPAYRRSVSGISGQRHHVTTSWFASEPWLYRLRSLVLMQNTLEVVPDGYCCRKCMSLSASIKAGQVGRCTECWRRGIIKFGAARRLRRWWNTKNWRGVQNAAASALIHRSSLKRKRTAAELCHRAGKHANGTQVY